MLAAYLQGAESDLLKMVLRKCEAFGVPVVAPRHDEIWIDEGASEEQINMAIEFMEDVEPRMEGVSKASRQ